MIPYIGPEMFAILLNKRTLERNELFISGCLLMQAAAKAARCFIARFVSKFFAIKAKRALYSQPPSIRCDIAIPPGINKSAASCVTSRQGRALGCCTSKKFSQWVL